MIRIAKITRRDDDGVFVTIEDIDPEMEWGPMEALESPGGVTDYSAGKRVIIASIGTIPDDYVVLGPIMESY